MLGVRCQVSGIFGYVGVVRGCAILSGLFCIATANAEAVRFADFASTQNFNLVGDARVAGKVLRLTRALPNRSGAFWFREKLAVRSGFEATFQFQLTHQDVFFHGTDGFAFVLQNAGPAALGGVGSAGGFGVSDPTNRRHEGIPWAVAVFFDTCRNPEEKDPSANYIAFRANGKAPETRWPPARLAFTPNLSVRLKDRMVHTARVVFQPPVLSVFLDGSAAPELESVVDLSIATDRDGKAWVGFTASTGWGWQNHDILSWSLSETDVSSSMSVVSSDITFPMSSCLPDRNLCTPERAFVEQSGEGYHVILPANIEWGATISNPAGRPVSVTNAKGIVCWDLRARGSQGCGGPSGTGGPAGAGFPAEGEPAGALITRNHDGRTWFSVNGRSGAGFEGNEGFYEFDVEVR